MIRKLPERTILAVLVICMSLNLGTSALAAEKNGSVKQNENPASPTKAIISVFSNIEPIGSITDEERDALLKETLDGCDDCDGSRHFSLVGHVHEVTSITSTYDGQKNRGVVAETVERIPTTAKLAFEMQRSISNSWYTTIAFEKNSVTAAVGFNVEYSTTGIASYSVDVPINKLASITLYDMYNVKLYDCKTTWAYDTIPVQFVYEYGTGWAEQWSHFGYGAKIW